MPRNEPFTAKKTREKERQPQVEVLQKLKEVELKLKVNKKMKLKIIRIIRLFCNLKLKNAGQCMRWCFGYLIQLIASFTCSFEVNKTPRWQRLLRLTVASFVLHALFLAASAPTESIDQLSQSALTSRNLLLSDATALANRLILVTGNERHFRRVTGLVVENWLELTQST